VLASDCARARARARARTGGLWAPGKGAAVAAAVVKQRVLSREERALLRLVPASPVTLVSSAS
jgi:hypothetical protein